MKPVFLLLLLALGVSHSCTPAPEGEESVETVNGSENTTSTPDQLLRHVVLFHFVDTTSAEKIREIEEAFAALPDKIPEIYDFEWGTNNSPEGLAKGHSHCFLVTFRSETDRDAYLPHPAHQAFVDLVGPYVEDVTVVDYWTKNAE